MIVLVVASLSFMVGYVWRLCDRLMAAARTTPSPGLPEGVTDQSGGIDPDALLADLNRWAALNLSEVDDRYEAAAVPVAETSPAPKASEAA
jgi:hypothetical protein